jgi:hypothetical protein
MEEKNDHVMRSFKRKKILRTIATLLVFAAAFFAFWYTNNREKIQNESVRSLLLILMWIASIGGLIFSFMIWRCPACKAYLGRMSNPRVCKKCGVKLHQ